MQWMIYGANGYTGRLIAQEAKARGLSPVLAGRSDAVAALARQLGLAHRRFDLDDRDAVRGGLDGIGLVLHCAGPFSATAAPMLEGCLAVGAHYLDITGEIDVFAHCHAQHARAQTAGIVVLPGAGFDVVPTDCLAAQLKRELPSATHLVLAFDAGVSCDRCTDNVSGSPLISTYAGTDGTFTLTNVPCGVDVPVVMQLGRWRRQVTMPAVACCVTTAMPATKTRLPRVQGEGSPNDNIPLIAVVTGSADSIENVLPKIAS